MNDTDTKHYSLEEIRKLRSRTDWARVAATPDHTGAAEIDIDWSRAEIVEPRVKQAISLRLDPDVLAFFKAQGKGYQTRMNAILRSYMLAQQKPRG